MLYVGLCCPAHSRINKNPLASANIKPAGTREHKSPRGTTLFRRALLAHPQRVLVKYSDCNVCQRRRLLESSKAKLRSELCIRPSCRFAPPTGSLQRPEVSFLHHCAGFLLAFHVMIEFYFTSGRGLCQEILREFGGIFRLCGYSCTPE